MTAQEYLKQYIDLKRKREMYLIENEIEIRELKDIAKHINMIPANKRKDVEARLKECIIFCNGLKRRAQSCEAKVNEIQAMIESVTGLEGEILKLRYIDGNIWEDICESVHYSWHSVFHKHDKALQMVEEMLKRKGRGNGIL